MIRIGAFDRHLEPLAWWEVELLPAGWYVDELLVEPAAGGVTGTVTSTLSDATLSATGTGPATTTAILIGSSNNPSYRSGFYSPRRGGTPKYPSLWDGCVGAWAPSLGATGLTLRDESVFGNHGTLTNMDPASDWVVSGGKGALRNVGTIPSYEHVVITHNLPTVTSATFSIWLRSDGTVENGAWSINPASALNHYPFSGLIYDSTLNGGVRLAITPLGGIDFSQWHNYTVVRKENESWKAFQNGIEIHSTTPSSSISWLSTFRFLQSIRDDLSTWGFSGDVDDIRIYNRALTPSEIRLLATRRGVAYESKRRLAVRSGAASPSGTLAKTLDSVTLTSSGTLSGGASTGSLSSTLADASLSASGTLASGLTGTVSSTLADATLSGTGTVSAGASGSVTRTLDAVTLSSSGTIGIGLTGSVSASLDAATLVSSGTVAAGASGTVTHTLDNATLSSTGGAAGTVTGSVSATLAAATCSSTGTLAAGLSGTVVRTLDAVTSSATGTLTNGASGTVTRTLANATLASGGSLSAGLTAQVNRALESCVVSSSGTLASGLTGTLSVQLASATLQSGNVAVGGLRIKVGGEWKNANAFVKVTGTWKNATPFVKVSGVWK